MSRNDSATDSFFLSRTATFIHWTVEYVPVRSASPTDDGPSAIHVREGYCSPRLGGLLRHPEKNPSVPVGYATGEDPPVPINRRSRAITDPV